MTLKRCRGTARRHNVRCNRMSRKEYCFFHTKQSPKNDVWLEKEKMLHEIILRLGKERTEFMIKVVNLSVANSILKDGFKRYEEILEEEEKRISGLRAEILGDEEELP